jgi:hypothetical protein
VHCRPSDSHVLPWNDIVARPDDFYETEAHPTIHKLLQEPRSLPIGSLFILASELKDHSNAFSPSPFRFQATSGKLHTYLADLADLELGEAPWECLWALAK